MITDHDQSINISTDKLCKYLHDAEERMQRELGNSLGEASLPAGVKRLRRENTPSDVLDEKDEGKYRRAEKKARQRREQGSRLGEEWGYIPEIAATG